MLVGAIAPKLLRDHYKTEAHCIPAASIALQVYETYGFSGELVPVEVRIHCKTRQALTEKLGRWPNPEEAKAAGAKRAVAIGHANSVPNHREWAGHLVALIEIIWLVDLSITQANDDILGFNAPIYLIDSIEPGWPNNYHTVVFSLKGDWFANYTFRRSLVRSWEDAPVWKDHRARAELAKAICRTIDSRIRPWYSRLAASVSALFSARA